MGTKISALPAAVGIDGSNDYLPIVQSGVTNKINRTTFLSVSGAPVGTSDSQSLSNKTIGNTNTLTLKDTLFTLQDDGDTTKQAQFQLSGITTGNTRTYTLPDRSSTIATLAGNQAFTGANTFTGSSWSGGTIDNATVTVDAVSGHTTSNTGTIYGISVSSGVISSSGVVGATALASNSVTSAKIASGAVTSPAIALSLATNNIYYNNGGTTFYGMTNSYAAVTGLTTPSITVAAGIVLVIGTVSVAQASATSADTFFRVIMDASTAPNYPTAGEIQETFSSATSNMRQSASYCAIFTGVTAGSHTFTAQAYCTSGTFRIENTHTNLLVIPLTS